MEEFSFLTTDDITISACPVLIEESKSLWGYYLCIENASDEKISIVGKNWNVADGEGNVFNDCTEGFKGEIPELEPGEVFEFTDVVPLNSSVGVFYGNCKILQGQEYKLVKIPTFSMDNSSSKKIYN